MINTTHYAYYNYRYLNIIYTALYYKFQIVKFLRKIKIINKYNYNTYYTSTHIYLNFKYLLLILH